LAHLSRFASAWRNTRRPGYRNSSCGLLTPPSSNRFASSRGSVYNDASNASMITPSPCAENKERKHDECSHLHRCIDFLNLTGERPTIGRATDAYKTVRMSSEFS